MTVHVQWNRIGDPAEADRCLDAMEQATGLRGERNEQGRLYVAEGDNPWALSDRIAADLPKGWQEYLEFEV